MKAFILCGGFGTRLRSAIGEMQKAVARINGRPFLDLVVEQLGQAGIRDLVFCTNYRADQVDQVIAALDGEPAYHAVSVREATPLGTGGAILNALHVQSYRGRFIVLNADTYLDANAYHVAAAAQAPVLLVTAVDDVSRYGAVELDDTRRVVSIHEKGKMGPGLISTGVYGFDSDMLVGFQVRNTSMEREILPRLIERGMLKAERYDGPFLDIGTPESLLKMREHGVEKEQ